jgi:hypothetical protein
MPFKNRKKISGFGMVLHSLDHFINKMVTNFLVPKRSRLAGKKVQSGFQMAETIQKPEPKSVRKMTIQKPDRPVFGRALYIRIFKGLIYHERALGKVHINVKHIFKNSSNSSI